MIRKKVVRTSNLPVKCIDCANANIVEYNKHDPLIAECKKKPDTFGVLDRDVARELRICSMFKPKNNIR